MFVDQGERVGDSEHYGLREEIRVVAVGGAARRTLEFLERQRLDPRLAIVAGADTEALAGKLCSADLVFVIACLGGETGSTAVPAVAALARRMGALTIAIVTMPPHEDGEHRTRVARLALRELIQHADTTLVIDADALPATSGADRFEAVHARVELILRAVSDCAVEPSVVSICFSDLVETFRGPGRIGRVGVGASEGEDGVSRALELARSDARLGKVSFRDASTMLVHITGGQGLTIDQFDETMDCIASEADDEARWATGLFFAEEQVHSFVRVVLMPLYATFRAQTPEHREAGGVPLASTRRTSRGFGLRSCF